MTPALRLRISTFTVLAAISFAVNAPSVYSAVEIVTSEQGSSDTAGTRNAGQTASAAPADNAASQYTFLDDSVFMTAFDTQEEYSTQVMGIHTTDPVIGFANTAGDAEMPPAFVDNGGGMAHRDTQGSAGSTTPGIDNAGQLSGSAPTAAGSQQLGFPRGSGGMANPGKPGKPSPAAGIQNANPTVLVAQAGEDDGLDPFVHGSSKPDLKDWIDPPEGVVQPTAGGNAPGNPAATECPRNGKCDAQSTTVINAVPEPGSLALLGLGIIGLVLSRRRKATIACH